MEEQTNTDSNKSMNMPLIGGIIVVLLLIAAGAYYFIFANSNSDSMMESKVQTKESMESPDAMMEDESKMMEESSNESDTSVMAGEDAMMVEKADATFEISAKNFEFSETELTVNEGDVVKIVLTSDEGFHDWTVDEFDAKTTVVSTGDTDEITFTADKAGEYEFYCSVGNHRAQGMVGTLTVE